MSLASTAKRALRPYSTLSDEPLGKARPRRNWTPRDSPPRRNWTPTDPHIPRKSFGPFLAKETTITRNAIYIRPERHLVDVSEAFALVRGLEQRFGRIQDFRFLREQEVPTAIQGFFWAVFADDSGRERMGAEEIKIKMRLPARKIYDGGVGLADIHRFLAPADLQPAEIVEEELKEAEDQIQAAAEDPSKQPQFELIDVEVKHAGYVNFSVPYREKQVRHGYFFALRWLHWGGFSTGEDATVPRPNLDTANEFWQNVVDQWKKAHPEGMEVVPSREADSATPSASDEAWTTTEDSPPPAWTPLDLGEPIAPMTDEPPPSPSALADTTALPPSPTSPTPTPPDILPLAPEPDALKTRQPPKMSRREWVLQTARESARAQVAETEAREKEAEAEAMPVDAKKRPVIERLRKLIGGSFL